MRTLTREEAAALLEQLAGSDNFSYSPSGKAIFAEIPPEDIRTRLG
jgi:DNA mismatch repair protein MutL